MKILVLNGPNMNMLGIREPALYGSESYEALKSRVTEHAKKLGIELSLYTVGSTNSSVSPLSYDCCTASAALAAVSPVPSVMAR